MPHDYYIVDSPDVSTIVSTPGESTIFSNEEVTVIITEGQQGPQGIKGDSGASGAVGVTRLAAIALGGHRLVMNAIDGRLIYASNDVEQSAYTILGITLGAAVVNASVDVQGFGLVTEPTWTWVPNAPIYLGTNGLMTQIVPSAPTALFSLVVGFAISATAIFLNLHEAIYLK